MADRTLIVEVISDASRFAQGMDQASQRVSSFGNSMERAAPASQALLLGLGGIATGLAAAGGAAIKLASDMEINEVAFTTMLGSAEDARAMLADLQAFAAKTPFQLPGLIDASKSLLAFGFDAEQIIPVMTQLGDIAAGLGIPVNELARLYGKARVQGRLFAEDINQLTGRGIPIIQELAKQFGVAESEIRTLVEEGRVNFGHLETAIASLTEEGSQFGGLMAAQSETLSGLMSTMADEVGLSMTALGKALIEAFDLKAVVERAISLLSVFRGFIAEFAADVEELGLAEAIRNLIPPDMELAITAVAGALTAALIPALAIMAKGVIAATLPLSPFLAAGAAVGALAYLIYDNWEPISRWFADMSARLGINWKDLWEGIQATIQTVLGTVQRWGNDALASLEGFWGNVQGVIAQLTGLIKSNLYLFEGDVGEVFGNLLNKARDNWLQWRDALIGALGAAVTAATTWMAENVGTYAVQLWGSLRAWVSDAVTLMGGEVGTLGQSVGQNLGETIRLAVEWLVANVGPYAEKLWGAYKAWLGAVIPLFLEGIKVFVTQIVPGVYGLWGAAAKLLIDNVGPYAEKLWGAFREWIVGALGQLSAGAGPLGDDLGMRLGEMVSASITWLTTQAIPKAQELWGAWIEILNSAIGTFSAQAPDLGVSWGAVLGSVVRYAVTALVGAAVGLATLLWNAIRGIWGTATEEGTEGGPRMLELGGALLRFFQGVLRGFMVGLTGDPQWADKLGDAITKIVNDALAGIKGIPDKFRAFGRSLIEGMITGIDQMIDPLRDKVGEVVGFLPNLAGRLLGTGSPSRVFAEIGADVMKGMELGIDQGAAGPLRAVGETVEAMTNNYTYNLNANFSGGRGEDLEGLLRLLLAEMRRRGHGGPMPDLSIP